MQACGGGGHGRAVFGGINGLVPEFVPVIGRALRRGQGENPIRSARPAGLSSFRDRTLRDTRPRGGFQNGGFIFVRQEKLTGSGRLSPGLSRHRQVFSSRLPGEGAGIRLSLPSGVSGRRALVTRRSENASMEAKGRAGRENNDG